MSIPYSTGQPANPPPPPSSHQNLSNGVGALTNHVHPPSPTVTITLSHLPSLGTTSPTPQAPNPLTRPSGFTPATTGQHHSQPRAMAGAPIAVSFARRIGEMDDPTAVYMRELIESVETARIG
ncbi:hypothetical protein VE01_03877 [Pseudogymnoascus verrucosus]|uniref:Uncharacterized protein n=1 Tax=Pseudogymnoascus verrucosus TaxID=342668 RepID=A0A1B8GQA5_9PEZI|nr:uncharacterized protein VE01_03877 [Pseudogymnoascus verrucosus]OBT98007.1 hypothetical protein VE01_03877 [Pseudogymnoascus verrucosus]